MAMLLLAAALQLTAVGVAISYTVQVVAVSDQDVALDLSRELLRQGYPAYVVRGSSGDRDVFRVRVGAFANRGAALSYAEAMPAVAGSRPVPALTETIPEGIMPFEPALLVEVEASVGLEILPWGDLVAVRIQNPDGLPAHYFLIGDEGVIDFAAWLALPLDEGAVLRVRNLDLWPSTWQQEDDDVRSAFLRSRVSLVATELGLEEEVVDAAVYREASPPYLVVVERAEPSQADPGELLALGVLGDPPVGAPDTFLGDAIALPAAPAPLYVLSADPPVEAVSGESWRATSDEGFTRVDPTDGGSGWRASVGVPLWAGGHYLLTLDGTHLRLFRLLPR